jgi:hypothetical protein
MQRALCGTKKDPIPLDLQIQLWGCPGKALGAHSNRKASYELLCGIIDGPPVSATMMRAGHKIGGVEEKYILQPRGGDEFCSRICAGFDLHSDDFATLPAHFSRDVLRTIDWSDFVWNYSRYSIGFQSAVPWLVASVVLQWQNGWIREHFPDFHPLFDSPFYKQGYLQRLSTDGNIVTATMFCGDCGLRATGIPAQVRIAKEVDSLVKQQSTLMGTPDGLSLSAVIASEIKAELTKMSSSFESTVANLEERVVQHVEERVEAALDRFALTHTTVGVACDLEQPRRMEVPNDLPSMDEPVNDQGSMEEEIAVAEFDYFIDDRQENDDLIDRYAVHSWAREGDKVPHLHLFPTAVEFKGGVSVGNLFESWFTGNTVTNIPPLKCLRSFDVVKEHENNLTKARAVIAQVVARATACGEVPPRTRLSSLTLERRGRICKRGVDEIFRVHNDVLRAKAVEEGKAFKACRPKSTTDMAYTTLHKYLHKSIA